MNRWLLVAMFLGALVVLLFDGFRNNYVTPFRGYRAIVHDVFRGAA